MKHGKTPGPSVLFGPNVPTSVLGGASQPQIDDAGSSEATDCAANIYWWPGNDGTSPDENIESPITYVAASSE